MTGRPGSAGAGWPVQRSPQLSPNAVAGGGDRGYVGNRSNPAEVQSNRRYCTIRLQWVKLQHIDVSLPISVLRPH